MAEEGPSSKQEPEWELAWVPLLLQVQLLVKSQKS
jgi:hypothetical protein